MRTEAKSNRLGCKNPDSWDWLDAIAGTLDEDFLKAVLDSRDEARAEAAEHATGDQMFS
jgi:hypothetical protein